MIDHFRCDVPSTARLAALVDAPLPLPTAAATRQLHRDLYLDTPDDALRMRGIVCRLRLVLHASPELSLHLAEPGASGAVARMRRVTSRVRSEDPVLAVRERSAVRRRLHALVDPTMLDLRMALEVERWTRVVVGGWFRRPAVELHFDKVTVRRVGVARSFQHLSVHRRHGDTATMGRLANAFEHDHGLHRVSADPRERADLLVKWSSPAPGATVEVPDARPSGGVAADEPSHTADAEFLNPDLSLIAFQARVLALAEDERTPLGERLRFIAIVAANLDEFYMVRIAGLKQSAREQMEEQADDGRTPAGRLTVIIARATALGRRQARCFRQCVAELARHGTRIRSWAELTEEQRTELASRFDDAILPALTPFAMTLSAGHPLPHFPHLSLSLAVALLGDDGEGPRFVELELPSGVPRFLPVGTTESGEVVPLEELVRANLHRVYPSARVEHAYLFRVTRGGNLGVASNGTGSLLDAVAAASQRRARNPAVRVEIERGMPTALRHAVLESLSREGQPDGHAIGDDDLQETEGFIDLRAAASLPLPDDPALTYAPFRGATPVAPDVPLVDAIGARDLLVHHPFDRFSATVVRFLREASRDPDVVAIKVTLYRVGDPSPVVRALLRAARRGVSVVAFVELQARFDEDSNVRWARKLEQAGGRVVYGLPGYKNHAKMALVVRREAGRLRSYAHVGTGNYNARSGRAYTDLSLFSADEAIVGDVGELFNALTGSSRPPRRLSHGALSSPHQLLPALLERIAREGGHARAGRPSGITIKVNGLSDGEVVRALYQAAQDGVAIDLIVRGICTLRVGIAGLSEGIRVVSVVGRFLEHSRVYRFANGGEPEYFLGSADLRPRNLRQRVELLVHVRAAAARAALDRMLALYIEDPTAWDLTASGEYEWRGGGWGEGGAAQEVLMDGAASTVAAIAPSPGGQRL